MRPATPKELKEWWDFIRSQNLDWVCGCPVDKTYVPGNYRNEEGHLKHRACHKSPPSQVFECTHCEGYGVKSDLAFSSPLVTHYCDFCWEEVKDYVS